jgi:hypothetical protein
MFDAWVWAWFAVSMTGFAGSLGIVAVTMMVIDARFGF